jgi:hypothetical protein
MVSDSKRSSLEKRNRIERKREGEPIRLENGR